AVLQGRRDRLLGLTECGGGRVVRRSRREGGAHDLQHRRRLLGTDKVDRGHRRSTVSPADDSSRSSSSFTSSYRSMITRCPAPSHSSSDEPAMWACSLRLWPMEVSLSSVPQMIVVGTTESALTVSNLSSEAMFGKNSATTSKGVDDSISSTNST